MRNVVLYIVFLVASCAVAQPTPQSGERVIEFVLRWDDWVETIPEDQRAWGLIQEVEAVVRREAARDHWIVSEPYSQSDEDMADWAWTVGFIESNSGLIAKIREYAGRAHAGILLNDSSYLYQQGLVHEAYPRFFGDVSPRHLKVMRSHQELLLADMRLANQEGESERVLQDIKAVAGMAHLSLVRGSMLDQLVMNAFGGSIVKRINQKRIGLDQFSEPQLVQLQSIMQEIEGMYSPKAAIEVERIFKHEFLDWIFEDCKEGELSRLGMSRWKLTSFNIETSDTMAVEKDQRECVNAYLNALTVDIKVPLHELRAWAMVQRGFSFHRESKAKEGFEPALYDLNFNMPFYLSNAPTENHATQLLIILHRHKLHHGEFPADLSGLDGDLRNNLPIDLFSGDVLKYKLIEGEPLIYSVGPDRDDDGGKPVLDEDGNPEAWPEFLTLDELEAINATDPASIDGDWILYPMNQ